MVEVKQGEFKIVRMGNLEAFSRSSLILGITDNAYLLNQRLIGLAHSGLPNRYELRQITELEDNGSLLIVRESIESVIENMILEGADKNSLRAYLVVGQQMTSPGNQNLMEGERILKRNKITIARKIKDNHLGIYFAMNPGEASFYKVNGKRIFGKYNISYTEYIIILGFILQ